MNAIPLIVAPALSAGVNAGLALATQYTRYPQQVIPAAMVGAVHFVACITTIIITSSAKLPDNIIPGSTFAIGIIGATFATPPAASLLGKNITRTAAALFATLNVITALVGFVITAPSETKEKANSN